MDEQQRKAEGLQEVWDYLDGDPTFGDVANGGRGVLKDKDRPFGECWACAKLAKEGMIYEQPGTAECCKGCDAYMG